MKTPPSKGKQVKAEAAKGKQAKAEAAKGKQNKAASSAPSSVTDKTPSPSVRKDKTAAGLDGKNASTIGSVNKSGKKGGVPKKGGGSAIGKKSTKAGDQSSYFKNSEGGGPMTDAELEIVRQEHNQVIAEEKRQKCWICLVILVCVGVAAGAVAAIILDRDKMLPAERKRLEELAAASTTATPDGDGAVTNATKPGDLSPKAHEESPIANLTELCVQVLGNCYYHQSRFVTDCKQPLTCNSVNVKIVTWNQFEYAMDKKPITTLPPDGSVCQTKSGEFSVCENGACPMVASKQYRKTLERYLARPKSGGRSQLRCGNTTNDTCISSAWGLTDLKPLVVCPVNQSACTGIFKAKSGSVQDIAIRFLSCNNPLPFDSEPQCFLDFLEEEKIRFPQPDDMPFVLYKHCSTCSGDFMSTPCPAQGFKLGSKCVSGAVGIPSPTVCVSVKSCVPMFDEHPNTYAFGTTICPK